MKSAIEPYKQKVWDFLDKMKPGELCVVDEICEKENQTKFIVYVKFWMKQFPYQGGLTFNKDYSAFYMTHIPKVVLKNNHMMITDIKND